MAQPIIKPIQPFDAKQDNIIEFTYKGSIHGIQYEITNIRTGETAKYSYMTHVTNFVMQTDSCHLVNGTFYKVRMYVLSKQIEYSLPSPYVNFYCYDSPNFGFVPPFTSDVSKFPVTLVYGPFTLTDTVDALQMYEITLRNAAGQVVHTSGKNYVLNQDDIHYTFEYVEDGNYKLHATGTTVNGMNIETKFVDASVKKDITRTLSLVGLHNNSNGSISITSNFQSIEGEIIGDPYYKDGQIGLFGDTKVLFQKGYCIKDDFTLELVCRDLMPYRTILEMSNREDNLSLQYIENIDYIPVPVSGPNPEPKYRKTAVDCYFMLIAANQATLKYVLHSHNLSIPDSDFKWRIKIQKTENIYQLDICEYIK